MLKPTSEEEPIDQPTIDSRPSFIERGLAGEPWVPPRKGG